MTTLQLRETHGGRDELIQEWAGDEVRADRLHIEVDGVVVALFEDRHFYPIIETYADGEQVLADEGGNEIVVINSPERKEVQDGSTS